MKQVHRKDGSLSAYGFACGYQESKTELRNGNKKILYKEGNMFYCFFLGRGAITSESFEDINKAREAYQNLELIELFKVVKIMRVSGKRKTLHEGLIKEEAQRIVQSYPDSSRSMIVFTKC